MSLPIHPVFFFVLLDPKQRGPAIDPKEPIVLAAIARHVKLEGIFVHFERSIARRSFRKVKESRKAYVREAMICMTNQSNDQAKIMAIISGKALTISVAEDALLEPRLNSAEYQRSRL